MKIYRVVEIMVTRTNRRGDKVPLRCFWEYDSKGNRDYGLCRFRGEFLRDHHIDGKTLARLLPAWAKAKAIRSLGPKVTAFYAENDKVVTRLHHSGFIVGSDEWYDWQETQPDPFRACRLYRESLGERV